MIVIYCYWYSYSYFAIGDYICRFLVSLRITSSVNCIKSYSQRHESTVTEREWTKNSPQSPNIPSLLRYYEYIDIFIYYISLYLQYPDKGGDNRLSIGEQQQIPIYRIHTNNNNNNRIWFTPFWIIYQRILILWRYLSRERNQVLNDILYYNLFAEIFSIYICIHIVYLFIISPLLLLLLLPLLYYDQY